MKLVSDTYELITDLDPKKKISVATIPGIDLTDSNNHLKRSMIDSENRIHAKDSKVVQPR